MRGWMLAAVGASLIAGAARAESVGAGAGPVWLTQGTAPLPPPPRFAPPGPVPMFPENLQRPTLPPTAEPRPVSGAALRPSPHMIGDPFGRGNAIRIQRAATANARARVTRTPIASGGAFRIAENESPRPVDRLFATYNYFNNVNTFGGRDFDAHREVFGFEKTFLDGDASFGMRVPVQQRSRADGPNTIDGFADLSLIFKYALINDRETGDVLSAGLVLTVPTGRDVFLFDGSQLESTLFQPWVGFIVNADRAYVHGFSSAVLPTDGRDVTFLSNDLGVGYRVYQSDGDELITLIAPTVEGHLFTPLSNRGDGDFLRAWDSFTLTTGVHIGLRNRAFLTLGFGVPLVGPRPYDFEALAQFNLRF